jgi:hypothetical protein
MFPALYLIASFLLLLQPDWEWRSFPESGFKILAPVVLAHDIKEVPTSMRIIKFHQFHGGSLTDSTNSMAFVIDHYLVPGDEEVNNDEYKMDFFENTIDELLVSIEGTLVYMDILHQADRDVCIWKGNYLGGQGVIRGHVVLSGNRYYGLQVFGLEKNKPDQMMGKFLDSFKILE